MKKEEFRNIIDDIQPDIYLENRLKAKVIGASHAKPKRIPKAVVALVLAAVIALGTGFAAKTPATDPENSTQGTTQNTVLDMMSGFIVLASAAESEEQTAIPLEINEGYDCGVKLIVTDIRNMTADERDKTLADLNNGIHAYRNEDGFFRGRSHTETTDEFYLTQYTVNEFRLNPAEGKKVKTVTVKNESEYGKMVFSINSRPSYSLPKQGHEITVSGDEFNAAADGFYWQHTEKMLNALSENNGLSFSAFNDTVTFTVEYSDGVTATGVVNIVFSENGEASAVCKDYREVK